MASRARASSLGIAALVLAACTPALRDGWYACPDGVCPEGFSCVGERCVRAASLECFSDANCSDDDPCLEVHCVSNRCERTPVAGACDDGDFCNGLDECVDGVCINQPGTAPPCDTCDPTMPMPCDCGMLGGACCGDGSCFEGRCDRGTCTSCGSVGEPCCLDDPCERGSICDGMSCIACGGLGQVCCRGLGLECELGLECADNQCAPPAGCSCASTETCIDGRCVRCGGRGEPCCGTSCTDGFICELTSMTCTVCGENGGSCCPAEPLCVSPDHECDPGGMGCVPCGYGEGAPCCMGAGTLNCAPGFFCEAGAYCTACGGPDQRCCMSDLGGGTPCAGADDTCVMGFCRTSCGGAGEPCCALRRCGAALWCNTMSVCM